MNGPDTTAIAAHIDDPQGPDDALPSERLPPPPPPQEPPPPPPPGAAITQPIPTVSATPAGWPLQRR
jgi:hypothetical protein